MRSRKATNFAHYLNAAGPRDGIAQNRRQTELTSRCWLSRSRPRSRTTPCSRSQLVSMREGGLVPAYTFPKNREDLSVLRVVVRAGLTFDMADLSLGGLRKHTASLERPTSPLPQRGAEEASAFSH
jgi:glutamate/tyrosine decarboxylase-like PLP-dependent enzyme